ncbi:SusC/RagA family TonB-linked outer membrane protein [Pedobacter sp. PF22-3]|uniref:SusC/RagA family TonB-linked outer membrane protein n=1 Tax=Pedobacter sp. PF22-3 TaxID=2994467 RepID=UPI002245D7AF|nr:SusC/RagA family TonB-linked outer membrane protein [Pedobacter sp. PF22-3]MCX2496009.1 SusC/RagA family TonB-linked outer membrane protein [Pedobacter sp. PF22-3]
MKKSISMDDKPCANRSGQNMGFIAKVAILLFAIFAFQLGSSKAQTVTLSKSNAKIVDVFKEIRKQTGYDFVYTSSHIGESTPVTINVKNASLESTLAACFRDQPLSYSVKNKTIVVKSKPIQQMGAPASIPAGKYRLVTGRVTDTDNRSLPGVTVLSKELNVKTATDKEGRYRIDVISQEPATLTFSFIGMESKQVAVNNRSVVDVTLSMAAKEMEEMVVTGYQTLKKSDVVGSTATINAKDLYLNGVNTIEQALQGKIAGLVVTNTSGLTGTKQTVRVRGTSTLSGSQEPIWVVDGVIQEEPLPFKAQSLNVNGEINSDNIDYIRNFVGNSIRWLNPMDIENVTVLKDASATAIYGIRAGNGVIVITTKKGRVGPPVISYSTNFSTTEKVTADKLNLMNSKERVAVSREIFTNGLTATYVNSTVGYAGALNDYLFKKSISADEFNARVNDLETVNTDWFDLLYRVPFSHGHNVSISGGSPNTRYYSSFGYNNSSGTARGNDAKGITGKISVNAQLSSKITIDASLSASRNQVNAFYQVDPYGYAKGTNRAIRATNPDGSLVYYPNASGFAYNILNESSQTGNSNKVLTVNTFINANYKIINGLNFQSLFSYSSSSTVGESYATEQSEYVARAYRNYNYGAFKPTDAGYKQSKLPVGGEYNIDQGTSNVWNWRNSLSYSKVFNQKHVVNFMFGHELSSTKYLGYTNTTLGYLRDRGKSFATLPTSFSVGTITTISDFPTKFSPRVTDRLVNTMGLYLTSSYTFDSRYVVNASIRNDRSNRFGQFTGEKFNPVWAGGLKWNVANEKWFKKSYWLSDLSVSGTFGYQRNIAANVSPDLIIKTPTGATSSGTDTYTGESLLTISSLPYGDLRWEQNSSMNLGLNFSIFNNKVSGSFEYYNKRGRELITSLSVPLEYGVTNTLVNGGAINNKGYEVAASFVPVRTKNFSWNVTLNTSKNINSVVKVSPQLVSWRTAVTGSLTALGRPVSALYAFKNTGIDPTNGYPTFDLSVNPNADPKDPTSYMEYVGKLDPDFISGLGMNFRYKMLTISSSFYLQVGGKKFLSPLYTLVNNLPTEYQNLSRQLLDRWSISNPNGSVPRLPDSSVPSVTLPGRTSSSGGVSPTPFEMYNYSTARVVSATALRCNNINLSYTLPASIVQRLKTKNINIGAGVSNVFAINSKDFNGLDAEVATGQQPRTRTFTFNLNLSL